MEEALQARNLFSKNRKYFINGLALAKIQKREYPESEELLQKVVSLQGYRVDQENALLLLSHTQAAQGKQQEAISSFNELHQSMHPRLANVKQNLILCYPFLVSEKERFSAGEHQSLEEILFRSEVDLLVA